MLKLTRNLLVGLVTIAALFLHPVVVHAEDSQADLLQKIQELQKRVEELEGRQSSADPWGQSNRDPGWEPFAEIDRMQREMNRLFNRSFSGINGMRGGVFSNQMSFDYDFDIKETDKEYQITFDMAGMDDEKVDFQISDHSITVKGQYSREDSQESPDRRFSASSFGSFMKTIPIPSDADASKVKTEKKDDRFVIILPKNVG